MDGGKSLFKDCLHNQKIISLGPSAKNESAETMLFKRNIKLKTNSACPKMAELAFPKMAWTPTQNNE